MSKRAPSGSPQIKKRTVNSNGKKYEYWMACYTEGYDTVSGRQIQRKITGKTQKEVAKKLREVTAALDAGTYIAPSKLTVGQWFTTWSEEYLNNVKPATVCSYKGIIKTHILPHLGAVKLDALSPHMLQAFFNSLTKPDDGRKPVSAKTVKNVYGVIHKCLGQALLNGYVKLNAADACILPRVTKKELKPMDEEMISTFLKAIRGNRYEYPFIIALFTGVRESELLALEWKCVDLDKGTIIINKQLRKVRSGGSGYVLDETKTGKSRTITVAPYVVNILRKIKREQLHNKLQCGDLWVDSDFVFTNEFGDHLKQMTLYKNFKKVMAEIGSPETRFHDLRHSYAMIALKNGDSIKQISDNLGHSQISTTIDIYSFTTSEMRRESAERMERFIQSVNV